MIFDLPKHWRGKLTLALALPLSLVCWILLVLSPELEERAVLAAAAFAALTCSAGVCLHVQEKP